MSTQSTLNPKLLPAISLILLACPWKFAGYEVPVSHPPMDTPEYNQSRIDAAENKRLRKSIAKIKSRR